jgi:hypothetical protein
MRAGILDQAIDRRLAHATNDRRIDRDDDP